MIETPTYPTAYSLLRLELARAITSRLLKREDITAVVVGGSVGRGCADEFSYKWYRQICFYLTFVNKNSTISYTVFE